MSAWTTGPAVVLTRYRGTVTAPDSVIHACPHNHLTEEAADRCSQRMADFRNHASFQPAGQSGAAIRERSQSVRASSAGLPTLGRNRL
jgi:predicted DNA binding CopG/RHH family protein